LDGAKRRSSGAVRNDSGEIGARRRSIEGLSESEVRDALLRFDPLWDELFPAEQARIVQLLVERIDLGP
jgi:hypothetical protein